MSVPDGPSSGSYGSGAAEYVTCDLGMLSNYNYYTGIIFKAYTYGTGEHIVTGGRYDRLLCQFGKDAAAVGFAIVIDRLMLALARQKEEIPVTAAQTLLLYEPEMRNKAIRMAAQLRSRGESVCLMRKQPERELAEYKAFADKNGIGQVTYLDREV